MPTIALRRLSNLPGIPDDRQVSYRIEDLNAYWSRLAVTLHVEYHFGLPEHWTPERRARFIGGFESSVRQWSRRHLLQSSGLWGTRHVEVHVQASATRVGSGLQWHVVALPPEASNARSHVQYRYSGHLPRGSTDGPRHARIAVVQLLERDLSCGWHHLRPGQGRHPSVLQMGAAHEVGHMLGMAHPGCPGNSTECYGDPDRASGQGVMGLGSWIQRRNYLWAQRLMELETMSPWTLVDDPGTESPVICAGPTG